KRRKSRKRCGNTASSCAFCASSRPFQTFAITPPVQVFLPAILTDGSQAHNALPSLQRPYSCGTNFTASASTLPSALLLTETLPPLPAANLKVPSRCHLPLLLRRLTRIVLVPSSDL